MLDINKKAKIVIHVRFHVVAEEITRFDKGSGSFFGYGLLGGGDSFLGRKGSHDLC